jgi:hypothetical protein
LKSQSSSTSSPGPQATLSIQIWPIKLRIGINFQMMEYRVTVLVWWASPSSLLARMKQDERRGLVAHQTMQCLVYTCSLSKRVTSIAQGSSCEVERLADHISISRAKEIIANCSPLIVVIHLHPSEKIKTRISGYKPHRNVGLFHCLKNITMSDKK